MCEDTRARGLSSIYRHTLWILRHISAGRIFIQPIHTNVRKPSTLFPRTCILYNLQSMSELYQNVLPAQNAAVIILYNQSFARTLWYLFFYFIYLNIFIQDIKNTIQLGCYHGYMWSGCTIKLCRCIKILFLKQSFKTIMGGSIFKVRWQTVPWNGTLVHKWISECFNIWLMYNNIDINSKTCISVMIFTCH